MRPIDVFQNFETRGGNDHGMRSVDWVVEVTVDSVSYGPINNVTMKLHDSNRWIDVHYFLCNVIDHHVGWHDYEVIFTSQNIFGYMSGHMIGLACPRGSIKVVNNKHGFPFIVTRDRLPLRE
ncbi:hypothetical protein FV222_09205 [Methylobacterium sp. WL103]|uniref:hypothetical protein n=1 Tax=Methylobacterium sp. WL103 TaxID=2603891 RepID=UPI0011CB8C1A|nr:hypothetical protein [Methylobacterium sp. WL103]TXN02800.1 hypothetical protein FV222_09205 [Methylobacterium sp. WL103]